MWGVRCVGCQVGDVMNYLEPREDLLASELLAQRLCYSGAALSHRMFHLPTHGNGSTGLKSTRIARVSRACASAQWV